MCDYTAAVTAVRQVCVFVCVGVCTKLLGYSVFLCDSVSKAVCHRRRPVRFTVIPVYMTGVCGRCVSFLGGGRVDVTQGGCDNIKITQDDNMLESSPGYDIFIAICEKKTKTSHN